MITADTMDFDEFYSAPIIDCRELRHYSQERWIIFARRKDNQVVDVLVYDCMHGEANLNVIIY